MNGFDLHLAGTPSEAVLNHADTPVGDPLAFLRELVQNSIDAGSMKVDVSCTFERDENAAPTHPRGSARREVGTAIIRVADWGSGMDRNIIDTHLTRLFNSEKEGDPTKIGRFGIGFSSVFAIQPDAVCVDTGRYGESWRVVFRSDRTFTRVRLSESLEGTTIRLFKSMVHSEFEALKWSVRHALLHYCPHVDVTLYYQGERMGAPLNVDALSAPLKVAVFEYGASIVVGLTAEGATDTASFYNRGLTLLVRPSEFAGISYKVSSPRLVPTPGREDVLHDEHYFQILATVLRLTSGPIADELSQRLDAGLRRANEETDLSGLQKRMASLLRLEDKLPDTCNDRVVACSPHGHLYTLQACEEAAREGRLFVVAHPSPLSAAASADGQIVLEDWQGALLSVLCRGEAPRLEGVFVLPLVMKETNGTEWAVGESLRAATQALLKAAAAPVGAVELGYLDYPGSGAGALPAVAQVRPFTISKLADSLPWRQKWAPRSTQKPDQPRSTWILNADHLTLTALLPLAMREPELAAYSIIKLCLFGGALTAGLDSELLTLAMLRRSQRREAPLTERLIASLTAAGEIDSPGTFTVDPEAARKNIRRSRLANPLRYVLDLVQAASLKGATHIAFKFGAGDMHMYFDGAPFAIGDFEQLYAAMLLKESGGDAEARRLLAMGLCTALELDPAHIQVESGNAFIELRPGHPDRHEVRDEPVGLTHIRLHQRLSLGMLKRYVDHLGGHLTEEVLLQEHCLHARIAITIDGRLISQGSPPSDVASFKTFATDEIFGAVGVAPLPAPKRDHRGVQMSADAALSPTFLRIIHHGVWIDMQLPIELLPGFRTMVESSAFRLDVSGEHVVQGQEYTAALRAVVAAQIELLALLCQRHLAALAREKKERERAEQALPEQHLRELLRGLLARLGGLGPLLRWAQIPIEMFPPDTIGEGTPGWPLQIADGAALLEVPIFPCTTGEIVPLSRLLRELIEYKTIAYSANRNRNPEIKRKLVLHVADLGNETLLRGLFGDTLECCDVANKSALDREHSKTPWRRRSYRPRLSAPVLIARVPLSGQGFSGEIGIEPHQIPRTPWKRRLNQGCMMRLLIVRDGCLLIEKTVPFPVPDMTVTVSGEFVASHLPNDALSDFQLAMIIESVFSSIPLLIEHLIRLFSDLPAKVNGAALLGSDEETLTWCACVLRRLLMLALSAESRQAARNAIDLPYSALRDLFASELRPHPLWNQLRELPLFETIDGTPLRPSDLEASAVRNGFLAVLCPSLATHPARLENWAALCHADAPPSTVWSEIRNLSASDGSLVVPTAAPPPFVLWLAPEERALRDQLPQQLPSIQIINAEPWLRAAAALTAARSKPPEILSLPEDCDFSVPLPGIEGMLGVVSESGFLHAREQEPRITVALYQQRHSLGSEEFWLPGGQFLSAVADHPLLRMKFDRLELVEDDAVKSVRVAVAGALPQLLGLLCQRPLPWPPLSRMLLLDAVTALFPRPAFRLAYDRLRALTPESQQIFGSYSEEAERDYEALLRLAVCTSRDRVEAVLEQRLAQPGPLSVPKVIRDVLNYEPNAEMFAGMQPEFEDLVQAPTPPHGAMAWIDALYPDSGGQPFFERSLNPLPALAAAPLLMTTDGAALSLAEVISDFRRFGQVLYSSSRAQTPAKSTQRKVIFEPGAGLLRVLHCLFSPSNVREASTVQYRTTPPAQPALVLESAQRGADALASFGAVPAETTHGGLIYAVLEELRALTEKNERLLDHTTLASIKIDDHEQLSAVVCEEGLCILNCRHPAVQLAQRSYTTDPQCVRFLASAVYTALSTRSGYINDAEAGHFHHHLAVRALAASRLPAP